MKIEKKDNWIDVSNLRSLEDNGKKGRGIDWIDSIGSRVDFKYDNLYGYFIIIDYKREGQRVYCRLDNGRCFDMRASHLMNIKLGGVLGVRKTCIQGKNDVFTLRQDLVPYFTDVGESKRLTLGSNKMVKCKCPNCGLEKEIKVASLVSKGFGCSGCGDGVSYPNKLLISVLSSLGVLFEVEKAFDWSDNKRYDIYIPSLSCIIENHGIQHYKRSGFTDLGGRPLEQEQLNDFTKEILARGNGIKYYVSLDCRQSSLLYIKESILNSQLPSIINFAENDIDWVECDKQASSSLLVKVCDLWNQGMRSTTQIAKEIRVSTTTVRTYLKKGNECGICEYKL